MKDSHRTPVEELSLAMIFGPLIGVGIGIVVAVISISCGAT